MPVDAIVAGTGICASTRVHGAPIFSCVIPVKGVPPYLNCPG